MLSYTVGLEDGQAIATASIGRNGALGAAALFGGKFYPDDVVATLDTRAWAVELGHVEHLAEKQPRFRELLFRTEQYVAAQARQIAACNACHTIAQRFCSWILRAAHETGQNELHITQEKIARSLGVQRASISVVANGHQEEGLLEYRRGRIFVADRAGLEQRACGCHAAIEGHYVRLIASTNPESAFSITMTDGQARRSGDARDRYNGDSARPSGLPGLKPQDREALSEGPDQ